jgi:heptosyltransferase-2
VLGDKNEYEKLNPLLREAENTVDGIGRFTLRQSAAILKYCAFYIGNDTGVKHLAAAMGIPIIEINGHAKGASPAHPDSPERFYPWHVPYYLLQPEHSIKEITLDEVKKKADVFFQNTLDRTILRRYGKTS